MIEVLESGVLATVQDTGRPGHAALGVPRSGAFDAGALRRANLLVGNDADAAGIEVTLGGLVLRAIDAVTVAVTGAPCPVGSSHFVAGWGTALSLPAGATVRLGPPVRGLRSYVGVRGGIALPPVLGSRSTDSLSGLGPEPLRAGDLLPVGRPVAGRSVSGASVHPEPVERELPVRFGPRDGWFTDPAALLATAWTVRSDSDRVGVRLDGPPLGRRVTHELPSEPVRPGAVQVPGDGRPIVFGPDAPVTGGYPVIAVLLDLDRAAQLRPGDPVRFVAGSEWRGPRTRRSR